MTATALASPAQTLPTTWSKTPAAGNLVEAATQLAEHLLTGDRLAHSAGVAATAAGLAETLGGPAEILIAAAWLHDIGYCAEAIDTGFHPVDGARLLDRLGWPGRITALVAYHSGARFVAPAFGLADALARYSDESSALSDALTYADQVTGAAGQPLPIEARMADMLRRHGPSSVNAAVHPLRAPYLLAVADRVRARLRGEVSLVPQRG